MDDAACMCVCAEHDLAPGMKVLYASASAFLVVMAGLVSGLTLGLMSIDELDLKVLQKSGTELEKKYAKRIEPVISRPHLLLVTLLIANAICAEALPIFLDRLLDPVSAILVSVSVVLVFGEIVPQAVCSRYGLQVGAYSVWLVKLLIFIFWILAYPISKLLDYLLGHQTALFRRPQLKALVDVQVEQSELTHQEAHVIAGALDMSTKCARDAMTPIGKVFALPEDSVLNEETLQRVLDSGHSRVPVYRVGNRQHMIGLVLVKELILLDPEDEVPIKAVALRQLPYIEANLAMYDILQIFSTGRSHMAVLFEKRNRSAPTLATEGSADPSEILALTNSIGPHPPEPIIYDPPEFVPKDELTPRPEVAHLPELTPLAPNSKAYLAEASSIGTNSEADALLGNTEPISAGSGALDPCSSIGGGGVHAGTKVVGQKSKIKIPVQPITDANLKTAESKGKKLAKSMTELMTHNHQVEGDYEVVGIITIEDVMEELLQHEILDETDRYVDNLRTMKVVTDKLVKDLPPHLLKLLDARSLYTRFNRVASTRKNISQLVLREPLLQQDVVVTISDNPTANAT